MQSTVVRVRPAVSHVPETFWMPKTEGCVQNEPVEMVPEHVVLNSNGTGDFNDK